MFAGHVDVDNGEPVPVEYVRIERYVITDAGEMLPGWRIESCEIKAGIGSADKPLLAAASASDLVARVLGSSYFTAELWSALIPRVKLFRCDECGRRGYHLVSCSRGRR